MQTIRETKTSNADTILLPVPKSFRNMKIEFTKMHGAGNDFIIMFSGVKPPLENPGKIPEICSRTRGIGADGIIFISKTGDANSFKMKYYNSDGSAAGMCGNGLRCSALYAHHHLKADRNIRFFTDSGVLDTLVTGKNSVKIDIPVTKEFAKTRLLGRTVYYGSTGVPHAVMIVEDIDKVDVAGTGRKIRFHSFFGKAGTNVDFVSFPEKENGVFKIRTYERGVEGETCACGTGISAAGLCLSQFFSVKSPVTFITPDKDILKVEINFSGDMFSGLNLEGPAVEVFTGTLKSGR